MKRTLNSLEENIFKSYIYSKDYLGAARMAKRQKLLKESERLYFEAAVNLYEGSINREDRNNRIEPYMNALGAMNLLEEASFETAFEFYKKYIVNKEWYLRKQQFLDYAFETVVPMCEKGLREKKDKETLNEIISCAVKLLPSDLISYTGTPDFIRYFEKLKEHKGFYGKGEIKIMRKRDGKFVEFKNIKYESEFDGCGL